MHQHHAHPHSSHHGHHHDHAHHDTGLRLIISILLNILITVAQVAGGLISGSMSLISDALHNFSDVVALVISYVANRLSRQKQTPGRTFGFKRAEILAAFINAAGLMAIAVIIGKEAIQRFIEPVTINATVVIGLAGFSIVMNGISVLLIRRDSHDNLNMRSAYLHLFTDMMTSVAVLLGGIAMELWNIYWIDGVLTIVIALYLIRSSWSLLIHSVRILLMFSPVSLPLDDILMKLKAVKGVEGIHHVHVWQLNEKQIFFEAHVAFTDNIDMATFREKTAQMESILAGFGIHHATLQPEHGMPEQAQTIVQE